MFASRWQFLGSTVLFGVHAQTEQLLLGSENGVDPVWICWTDQRLAEHQLPSGYVLRQGPVREILPVLPAGTGVRIDPGLEQGMSFDGVYLSELVPLCVPFPAGSSVDLGELSIPQEIRRVLAGIVDGRRFVERLWLVRFRVADGPAQGLLVYAAPVGAGMGIEVHETVTDALAGVLDGVVRDSELDRQLAGVQIVAVEDLPDAVRSWVEEGEPLASVG
ncbi:MAG TPA: hypothetical protein VFG72_16485 [Marmoricola sp.]|nr:hypothetical protein [Marmoricola sp.]